MLLRNKLYKVECELAGGEYLVQFDGSHPVFAGHFPGHPIVPGACLVQIAEELLSEHLGQHLRFTAIRNLKFRQPITPDKQVTYTFVLSKRTPYTYIVQLSTNGAIDADFTATYMCNNPDVQ